MEELRRRARGRIGDLEHRRLGPAGRRRRRMAAGVVVIVVIIIVIVIARLAGVTGAVEFLVGDEGAQVVEADVAGTTVAWPGLVGVQALVRRRRVLTFLLHFAGDRRHQRRWWRRRWWRWLRTLPYICLAVHLDLRGDFFRRRGGRGFWRRQRRLVVQHARYIILLLRQRTFHKNLSIKDTS